MASNRHPENVITTALLRLQAKKEAGNVLHSVDIADSQVSRAARAVNISNGTTLKKAIVAQRKHSWQAHLERISPYLLPGEGVWWKQDQECYHFFDGPSDPDSHEEGPRLLHYREKSVKDVVERQATYWKELLKRSTTLLTATLVNYDEEGDFQSFTVFEDEIEDSKEGCIQMKSLEAGETTFQTSIENNTSIGSTSQEPSSLLEVVAEQPFSNTKQAKEPIHIYKTKLGKAIHKALGSSANLDSLDSLRYSLKLTQHKGRKPNSHSQKHEQYMTLRESLKQPILEKLRESASNSTKRNTSTNTTAYHTLKNIQLIARRSNT